MFFFIYLYFVFLTMLFNLLCNSISEQGHLEPWRYRNAFIIITRQVTRATHVRNRICTRVKLKIIIILLIIFLGFIKSKSC